jgi:uncharacterized DUF497 family protein
MRATVVSGDFEGDPIKATLNLAKHGIGFDEAALALASDANELALEDPTDPARVISSVMSPRTRILVVVSTERTSRTRIGSARKADAHEQRIYTQGRP